MKWFKFYGQDWHTDPKIASMSMEDRLCLIALFSIAAAEEKNGLIPFLSEDTLIKMAGIPDCPTDDYNPFEQARGVLQRYVTLQIVTLSGNGSVTVRNWGSRQVGNASNAEKQKRYRERLKQRAKSMGNVTVTPNNAVVTPLPRVEEIRNNTVEPSNDSTGDIKKKL